MNSKGDRPAFPCVGNSASGLTVREYIAAQMMAAIISRGISEIELPWAAMHALKAADILTGLYDAPT